MKQTMAASQSVEFPYFPELPSELREMIWELCLPFGRVVEIDPPAEVGV